VWLIRLGVRLIKVWGSWVARPKPWEVNDELWAVIEPLLPKVERRSRYPGRKRLDDRLVLQGILFVLHTGISWEHLPQELGFGSGMTCWRRLAEWHEAGVWQRLHEVLLAKLQAADAPDFSHAVVDSSHVRALIWNGLSRPRFAWWMAWFAAADRSRWSA
jgi:transposase